VTLEYKWIHARNAGETVKSGNHYTRSKTGVYNMTDRCHLRSTLTITPKLRPAKQKRVRCATSKYIQRVNRIYTRRCRFETTSAVSVDEDNKNTKWQDSPRKNSVRLMNMTFNDKGKGYQPGPGVQKIRVHLIYCQT
jgi:hypothetical protein